MKKIKLNQAGIGHLLIIAVILVLGLGGAGYYVWSQKDKKTDNVTSTVSDKALEAACKKEIADDDFCKFASNFSLKEPYKSVITDTGVNGTSIMTLEVNGKNSRMTTTDNGKETMASITIDNTTYIKDLSDGVWTKYTSTTPEAETVADDLEFKFDDGDSAKDDKTEYKKIGKEACGNLTCFKYQIVDSENPKDENFIWFDDKDYKLRRWSFTGIDSKFEMVYTYETVNITAPTPVKDAPNYEGMSPEELQRQLEAAMQSSDYSTE
jgi:hypothetical protein